MRIFAYVEKGWFSINVIAMMMFVLFSNYCVDFIKSDSENIGALIHILYLFIMNAFVISGLYRMVVFMSEKARSREMILQTQLLKVQIEQLEEIKTTYQRYRHDERHHNLLISEFAKNGQIEQLLEYVGNLEEEQEKWRFEELCNDDTINSVLVIYKGKASKQNILFQSFAVLPAESQFATIDLAVIISNMLENAYHASLVCKSPFITFHMQEKYGKLVIECKNSCSESVEFHNGMPKAIAGHGIGTHSMVSYVKKYNGEIQFSEEKKVFQVKIVINM
ncbi:sensor histidine kinase [Chakrabartyella piscis]|uniref:sensor histidine kinase n=1 Tax=Chakrabartyella piscis TaxID=2918914 RepID=UPI0029588F0C|nr:GHKL domain-containing protein [Chakrabartyella piscis]